MMFSAQTSQGTVTWLSDMENPLIGSPFVILRLRDASERGLIAAWPAAPVEIDLSIPGDVVFALEAIYGPTVTFGPDTPEPTEFFEPFDPDVIY
tara:strand:+ start:345 stop:626 length:282 start_codon:yes stop_codon:yes gene_type:complete